MLKNGTKILAFEATTSDFVWELFNKIAIGTPYRMRGSFRVAEERWNQGGVSAALSSQVHTPAALLTKSYEIC
jgi:hypothetical protein